MQNGIDIIEKDGDIIVATHPIEPWQPESEWRCTMCGLKHHGQDRIGAFYCIGRLNPPADPAGIQPLCAGIAHHHLHMECTRCRFKWLMQTKVEGLARE